ncbi:HAD-IA family hydrolase [Rhodobacteraceae bacterium 2CG4]|uniref:phosphoglycolate phosphatase n=1 Tax=Halovulum marinum TaxID=2662447 RepID=A0A6L5YZ08_9RHOB|nr:HAD-IA family hydrolase [Halovulum marinum]MSU89140.1 HAD-IA family hydrolase [Halovulum marinum]
MRTAIFDLDGTLADTSADLIAAANGGFSAPLLDPVADSLVAFHGGRAMLRLAHARTGTPEAEIEAAIEAALPGFLSRYEAGIDTHTRLYDGAARALDRLAGQGWALGVCTNKPVALAELLLTRLGIRDRFAAMLGADSLPVRKPDPRHLLETIARAGGDAGRAVLVGDTETDVLAARAAGVPCVLVGFGPEGAGVARLGPAAVLASYTHLPEILERLDL